MSWIETYQNIANLVVCGGVSATLYAYYNIGEQYLNYAIPLIVTHFTTDLFLTTKPDLMLHHVLGLTFIAYKYAIPVQTPHDTPSILVMYKTEISTFFYVFKLMLQNSKYKNTIFAKINDILFFVTFFKFRIYDYYTILIGNHDSYIDYVKYNYYYIIFGAIHSMFILNLYWFLIICKITLKPLIKLYSQEYSEYICHYITAYTMFLNLFSSLNLYFMEFNGRYIYNIIGIITLAITSCNYHTYCYEMINENNDICYTSNNTIVLFLQDIAAIHFCSFTALLTNYDLGTIVYFSGLLHILCYLTNIVHVYYLKNKKTIVYGNNEHYNNFVSFQYICIIIPNGIDIFLIITNSLGTVYSIHGVYISLFLLLLFIVNPLYDLTHIAFHIGLIIQGICCAQCNIYSIQNNI